MAGVPPQGNTTDRALPDHETERGIVASARIADLDALDDTSRELFMALRKERTELARERSVPPYVICHDRTLLGLAVQRPTTDGGLAGVQK